MWSSRSKVRALAVAVLLVGMPATSVALECGGDVRVTARDGVVTVVGDDEANCIHFYVEEHYGTTIGVSTSYGTTVHGDTDVVFLPPTAGLQTVKIDLKDGADRIDINDITASNVSWIVRGGAGNDFLGLGRVSLDKLLVLGGAGDDTLALASVQSTSQVRIIGSGGTADNLILDGEIVGRLALSGIESHERPALSCPLAEQTVDGLGLVGLADLEVVTCSVDKDVDATAGFIDSSLDAVSTESGDEYTYRLKFVTAYGISITGDPGSPMKGVYSYTAAEAGNESLGTSISRTGVYYSTPPYWLDAFEQCRELFVQACPDHLNSYSDSGVVDIGPGASDDDGGPI